MHFQAPSYLLAIPFWLMLCWGCHTSRPQNNDVDELLQSVSFDTSHPPPQLPQQAPEEQPQSSNTLAASTKPERRSFGKAVRDGAEATAVVAFYGMVKLVEACLGSGDDDKYESTPRGRADRNRDEWIAERDRWRKEPD